MDEQLHERSFFQGDTCKLVKTSPSENHTLAFLFEPKDLVPFETAWRWQRDWQKSLMSREESLPAVWILQHPHCFTLGRGASESNLLFSLNEPPLDVFRIDRGGEVTYHLPGQIVVYIVVDLRNYKTDLNWYLRKIEQVLIDVLEILGMQGQRIPGMTGLWLNGTKVGAIGVGCRRWITQHGLALNVECELDGFNQIVPCGLRGCKVGRLSDYSEGLTVADVQPVLKKCLSNQFGFRWVD